MKILVTGFDPFGGEKVNPAIESVKKLPDVIEGWDVVKLEIPTICHQSLEVIDKAIQKENPDVILSIGQAGGRVDISVERVGINCDDCRIPDNAGQQIVDEPVYSDGPAAYFSTLPIKAIVENVKSKGIPASVSNTAGTFVCNHVLYGVRHLVETKYPGKRSGFIHIPFLPEQTLDKKNMPSMPLEMIVRGLTAAIETIVTQEKDIKVVGGETH
ncbi:MAG: pyroglutamyl-peptidase I [Anaerorhabdus sp.]